MKSKLYSISIIISLIFLSHQSFAQSNSVSLSTSPLWPRTINEFYGLNGANTLLQETKFAEPEINKLLKEAQPSRLRYPGGTLANYWDWQEGWFLRNFADKGCFSLPVTYQNRKRLMPALDAFGNVNLRDGDYLLDLRNALLSTGAKPLFVVNPLTSDLNYQMAMLLDAKEHNIPIDRVEIGNEFFLDGNCGHL